jgi:hypothetical protein
MSKTGRLGLPYIMQGQAQKEVTHNQALNILDVYVNTVVEAMVTELPAKAKDGKLYIIDNELTQYSNGNWTNYPALEYMEVWLKDKQIKMIYDGKNWLKLSIIIQKQSQ